MEQRVVTYELLNKMKFGVVVFPGSNCDADCVHVLREVLKQKVFVLWHKQTRLPRLDCVVLPGGFSYGDYLRTGAIARFSPIMLEVVKFANRGGWVMGICNGFQILLEAGLLPGAMLKNRGLRFICETIILKRDGHESPFTRRVPPEKLLRLPIAHGEGNYFIDPAGLERLEGEGQVVFRYVDPEGRATDAANPNGSLHNIAGIVNARRNVIGMMPHPERASESIFGSSDGRLIFEGLFA